MPSAAAPPLRVAFVASQDPRVLANGVNSHSRLLKAALRAVGARIESDVHPVVSASGRARLFGARALGRLAPDRDRRALRDLETRHAILVAALRADHGARRAEVVHAQDFVAAAACLDALGADCPPLVLAHHANGLAAQELASRLHLGDGAESVRWCARESARALARAARVVAVSPWAAEVLRREAAVPEERLAVVPNGVAVPPSAPDDGGRQSGRVLAVGQLVERKGLDILVRAMAAIAASGRAGGGEVRALVLGDGPESSNLQAEARRLRAPVEFPGAASPAEVAAEMRLASVFALPSRAENLPMALLEAMAAGLPCVASDVGSVAQALQPEGEPPCGLVVPPGDEQALGDALWRLMAAPDEARALGRRAYERARAAYGTEAMARRWLDVYRDAIAGRGAS